MAIGVSGDPTEYDSNDEAAIEAAMDDAWAEYEADQERQGSGGTGGGGGGGGGGSEAGGGGGGGAGTSGGPGPAPAGGPRISGGAGSTGPLTMRVTARIEWNGTTVRSNNGVRTVSFDQYNAAVLRPDLEKAQRQRQRANNAGSSFTAKGWQAQYRQLTKTARGRSVAEALGLTPSKRTSQRWLQKGTTAAPSKSNRERIAHAYNEARHLAAGTARERARRSTSELVRKMTDGLESAYGGGPNGRTTIRFFDIQDITFE